MEIVIGATGSADLVVRGEDTAIALGSGDVPVLGTPRLVALLEEAAVAALAGMIDDFGQIAEIPEVGLNQPGQSKSHQRTQKRHDLLIHDVSLIF